MVWSKNPQEKSKETVKSSRFLKKLDWKEFVSCAVSYVMTDVTNRIEYRAHTPPLNVDPINVITESALRLLPRLCPKTLVEQIYTALSLILSVSQ